MQPHQVAMTHFCLPERSQNCSMFYDNDESTSDVAHGTLAITVLTTQTAQTITDCPSNLGESRVLRPVCQDCLHMDGLHLHT